MILDVVSRIEIVVFCWKILGILLFPRINSPLTTSNVITGFRASNLNRLTCVLSALFLLHLPPGYHFLGLRAEIFHCSPNSYSGWAVGEEPLLWNLEKLLRNSEFLKSDNCKKCSVLAQILSFS